MTDRGDGGLAAVSGGADSVCLLLLLCELAAELGIHVSAFHMNHGSAARRRTGMSGSWRNSAGGWGSAYRGA